MRSQEDADCYRKEYNGVLLKLVSFKKAKESAERALNRYSVYYSVLCVLVMACNIYSRLLHFYLQIHLPNNFLQSI